MHRKTFLGRTVAPSRKSLATRRASHLGIQLEVLEQRQMLSANDLLLSTVDDTHGASVLRYDTGSELRIPGGAATGGELNFAAGLAVAPDGSYYVSSITSAAVLHFDNSGNPLPDLGAFDTTHAPLVSAASLAFGPNGHLYVADLFGQAIYQFDTTSGTQQYIASATQSLPYQPGGIAFAKDGTNDLIVGDLTDHSVIKFNNALVPTTIIAGSNNINASTILPLANGNMYIADFDDGGEPTLHHKIILYNPSTPSPSFTTFLDTNATAAPPGEPLAMLFDTDGNLIVGVSPDHAGNGAVEKFDINDKHLITVIASGIGTPSGLAFIPSERSDVLMSAISNTTSVERYQQNTYIPVPGGAPTSGSLSFASGLAVAPDGSYYVSSIGTGQVDHFDKFGNPLPPLGAADAVHAPLVGPGSLVFGPNGNLYVADIFGDAIYQFDVSPGQTQQYQASLTQALTYEPGGLAFTLDASRDLIVGDLTDHSVVKYHNSPTPTTLIAGSNNINAAVILPAQNGNLYIADFDNGGEPTLHHRVILYNPSTPSPSFTTLIDTDATAGPAGEPLAMMFDRDGNLLVGVSPTQTGPGALERFISTTGSYINTFASGTGAPSGLAFLPAYESTVSGRSLFYQGSSRFDTVGGPRAPLPFSDDNAIAPDKTAYLPTGFPATYANVSNYDRGINGVMVDLLGQGDHSLITASDFIFKTGNDNTPNATWTPVVNPTVTVRLGMTGPSNGVNTVGNSDRVELTWPSGAVTQNWLEVIVKANGNTGLAANDVFFFGSQIGNTGVSNSLTRATTTGTDTNDTVNHGAGIKANIAITNLYDFNRDGQVNGGDTNDVVNHGTSAKTGLLFINQGSAGPFAPEVAPAAAPAAATSTLPDAGVASALAATASPSSLASTPPRALLSHLQDQLRGGDPLAKVFAELAGAKSNLEHKIVADAEKIADALGLDAALLELELARLGLD